MRAAQKRAAETGLGTSWSYTEKLEDEKESVKENEKSVVRWEPNQGRQVETETETERREKVSIVGPGSRPRW